MQNESSESIAQWGEKVFGPVESLNSLIDRAEQEMVELRKSVSSNKSAEEIADEAADVAILLHRLVGIKGLNLTEAVNKGVKSALVCKGV